MECNIRRALQPPSAARRTLLLALASQSASPLFIPLGALAQSGSLLTRPIPSSGEALPVIGLGSWITFNVGNDSVARDNCAEVMRTFFAAGGRVIDSSPMYGSSQEVIGYGLGKLMKAGLQTPVFAADKVWISPRREVGIRLKCRANTGTCGGASIFCKFITCSHGRNTCRCCLQ